MTITDTMDGVDTKNRIVEWAKGHSPFQSSALVRYLGISRQNVAAHIRALVDSGRLRKEGSTRGAQYRYAKKAGASTAHQVKTIVLFKRLKNLEEDVVFREVDRKLELSRVLPQNAHAIISYAFTEMLNNAIDHSRSRLVRIAVTLSPRSFEFAIRDFGIGVYFNVTKVFKLQSELEGLEHVLKGKQTTDPKRHSGEGIFFTSKIADTFRLRSHRLATTIDNNVKDTFIKEGRPITGTLVEFNIRTGTKKQLSKLFESFTNADFEFDKSRVSVKLSREGGLLSRSQAKRLLLGLVKYKRVTLDFEGVRELGQGFADEIFRVFQLAHPEMVIDYVNAIPVVEMMIRRAIQNRA